MRPASSPPIPAATTISPVRVYETAKVILVAIARHDRVFMKLRVLPTVLRSIFRTRRERVLKPALDFLPIRGPQPMLLGGETFL